MNCPLPQDDRVFVVELWHAYDSSFLVGVFSGWDRARDAAEGSWDFLVPESWAPGPGDIVTWHDRGAMTGVTISAVRLDEIVGP